MDAFADLPDTRRAQGTRPSTPYVSPYLPSLLQQGIEDFWQ